MSCHALDLLEYPVSDLDWPFEDFFIMSFFVLSLNDWCASIGMLKDGLLLPYIDYE